MLTSNMRLETQRRLDWEFGSKSNLCCIHL